MPQTSPPLLSVVIPTFRRPTLLARAIESALNAAPSNEVEVLVLPNGNDDSWKAVSLRFSSDNRVQWHPIALGNANIARNHGLQLSKGTYIRFLDDDDYLLPEAADQLAALVKAKKEFSSARVLSVDMSGCNLGPIRFPDTLDFVAASAEQSGFTLPVGNLYLREAVTPFTWDPSVKRLQDNIWMLSLAASRDWSWLDYKADPVGVWYQHDQGRLSSAKAAEEFPDHLVTGLKQLWQSLLHQNRMTPERSSVLARTLWNLAHYHFPFHPMQSHAGASLARSIQQDSRPDHPIFRSSLLKFCDPLLVEWLLFTPRLLTTRARNAARAVFGEDYRRKL